MKCLLKCSSPGTYCGFAFFKKKNFSFTLVPSEKGDYKKRVRFGALPVLNHTEKRKYVTIVQEKSIIQPKAKHFYKSFDEVCKRIPSLKSLTEWNIQILPDRLHVKKFIAPYTIPTYSIQIDTELAYFIAVYEWHLPDNHEIYKLFKRNLRNVNFIDIVNKVVMYNMSRFG